MEILWLMIGLFVGGGLAATVLLRRQAALPAHQPASRWPIVLVPTMVSEGAAVPQQALAAAYELTSSGKVLFHVFIEVPRTLPLTAPLAGETEVALHLIEVAEEHARTAGRQLRGEVQKVREYSYGVVEAARQSSAAAVVLEAAAQAHKPEQRGQRGSSLHLPNIGTLTTLVHERTGCAVVVVSLSGAGSSLLLRLV